MPHLKAYDKEGSILAIGYNVKNDQGSVIIPNLSPHTHYPQGEFYVSWEGDNYESEKVVVPEFTTLESSYKEITFYAKDILTVKPKTAYDIAVDNGFSGTEEEWVKSIKGEPGEKGEEGFSDYLDISTFNIVDDGITDNRFEITRIIQKAKEENKKVFIPKVQGKGYYVSNYININGGENIKLASNSATIIGKGFNFNNVSGIEITGFIFKGKNTDTYSDDGIRVYNSSNINITNNMFNSSFIRCRVENQEDSNENINIDNNILVGDVENHKNSSSSNLIEVYGYKNVTINNNYINAYNYHRFIKLSSIIFTGVNELQTIRDKGIVDGITITNNVIKGSVNNKQVIDGFSGINNLVMHNNLFDVKGATTIFENKISSGSNSFKVASCRQLSIKDNTVNVYDSTMSNVFYMYSYMGTPLQETETNHYSNVELSGNKVNNYTDKDITLGTIAGFKNVVVTGNVLNSNSNKGIFYAMSIHSSENVVHTNNVYNNGSVLIHPYKDTADSSVPFNMSSKNIISKGNMYNDIRSYGGEVIRAHKNINNITISNNNYIGNKDVNDYILSNIYIRDIISNNTIISGNSSVFDQEQSNITRIMYSTITNFKEYGNSWNKNDSGNINKEPVTIELTTKNDWVHYSDDYKAKAIKMPDGMVYLYGMVKDGTPGQGSVALTLPIGFRPRDNQVFGALVADSTISKILLDTVGNFTIETGTQGQYISLSGISFYAGN